MSRLSDILEAALPHSTSSPACSRTVTHTPDPAQPSQRNAENSPYGDLAKEFGIEAHLVEALAQRLSRLS